MLSVCATFAACDQISNEPVIEGRMSLKVVGAQAQDFVLKVTNYSGAPYNHKTSWRVVGIAEPNDSVRHPIINNILNVLPDESVQVSYDWMSCIIPPTKDKIRVTVAENTTGTNRRLTFYATGDKSSGPTFTIVQKAEKD